MQIRKATADEMLNLWGYRDISAASPTAKFFYSNISSGNAVFWTLAHSGELIGELYAFLNIKGEEDFADGITTAYLCAFRVEKKYQGQGLGSKLMNAVLADLKLCGFQYATIGVGLNEERNLRIYDHMGFSKKIKNCYFDPSSMDENMKPQCDEGFLLLSKQL